MPLTFSHLPRSLEGEYFRDGVLNAAVVVGGTCEPCDSSINAPGTLKTRTKAGVSQSNSFYNRV